MNISCIEIKILGNGIFKHVQTLLHNSSLRFLYQMLLHKFNLRLLYQMLLHNFNFHLLYQTLLYNSNLRLLYHRCRIQVWRWHQSTCVGEAVQPVDYESEPIFQVTHHLTKRRICKIFFTLCIKSYDHR